MLIFENNSYCLNDDDRRVQLTEYRSQNADTALPVVVVLPGGGYVCCAPREGAPVAERFSQKGYDAFLLKYSTLFESFEDRSPLSAGNINAVFPGPLMDLGRAMLKIRGLLESRGQSERPIVLCGFSAGGHLAASLGVSWQDGSISSLLNTEPEKLRPAGLILCYSPTDIREHSADSDPFTYAITGCFRPDAPMLEAGSPLLFVGKQTPPTFLWHSARDDMVPPMCSLDFASELIKAGVPCEAHIFPFGPHATGLSSGFSSEIWPELADRWLRSGVIK